MTRWAIISPDGSFREFYGSDEDAAKNVHDGQSLVELPEGVTFSTHTYIDGAFVPNNP